MNTFCKWGIHRPLNYIDWAFTDTVSGKKVWYGECQCGKLFMTDGGRWFGFKVLSETFYNIITKA